MLHHFHNPEIAGVTGPTRLWNTGDPVARFLAYVRGRRDIPRQQGYIKIAPTMNLALRRNVILELGGFDESLVRCEDTELTYKVTKRYRILYEPEAIVWFKGSQTLTMASSKCIRHFTGVGQLFAKHGFNPSFVRPDIPVRGIILIVATASVFFIPWYVPTSLFTWLFAEFVYNMVKMYWRYRDTCVFYYVVFFTFWSLVSMTILYGLCLGLKNKGKIVKRKKLK